MKNVCRCVISLAVCISIGLAVTNIMAQTSDTRIIAAMLSVVESQGEAEAFIIMGTMLVCAEDSNCGKMINDLRDALDDIASVEVTEAEGYVWVAAYAKCEPTRNDALYIMERMRGAFGNWEVAMCVVGSVYADSTPERILAALNDTPQTVYANELYDYAAGSQAQVAIRANGEIYVGVPYIPIEF